MLMLVASVMCLGLLSCAKENNKGVSGYYSTMEVYNSWYDCYNRHKVYEFINKNTVIDYGVVWPASAISKNEDAMPLPNKTGWYYIGTEGGDVYTYVIEDNKIFLTNGKVLTIEDGGNSLIPDGGSISNRLYKW